MRTPSNNSFLFSRTAGYCLAHLLPGLLHVYSKVIWVIGRRLHQLHVWVIPNPKMPYIIHLADKKNHVFPTKFCFSEDSNVIWSLLQGLRRLQISCSFQTMIVTKVIPAVSRARKCCRVEGRQVPFLLPWHQIWMHNRFPTSSLTAIQRGRDSCAAQELHS